MKQEPAAIATAITSIVALVCLLVFGKELTDGETAAILTAATVIAGFFVRQNVTPVAKKRRTHAR